MPLLGFGFLIVNIFPNGNSYMITSFENSYISIKPIRPYNLFILVVISTSIEPVFLDVISKNKPSGKTINQVFCGFKVKIHAQHGSCSKPICKSPPGSIYPITHSHKWKSDHRISYSTLCNKQLK